ncbi:MAG TPA: hypothetical protein VGB85_27075 [Nannocystis sp.]|jgi:hypothetical protein
MSEIADNKWEAEAAKPPVSTVSGIAQILLIACFAGVFVYILQGSARGLFSEKKDGLAENYGKMTNEAGKE